MASKSGTILNLPKDMPIPADAALSASASTQNHALNALVFFYGQVLGKAFREMGEFARAKRPQRLPEVLTRDEVETLLSKMDGVTGLMAGLMYGGGLRLMECVRLRVKDVDFARNQIMVRDGKGQKDRVTMLPERRIDDSWQNQTKAYCYEGLWPKRLLTLGRISILERSFGGQRSVISKTCHPNHSSC